MKQLILSLFLLSSISAFSQWNSGSGFPPYTYTFGPAVIGTASNPYSAQLYVYKWQNPDILLRNGTGARLHMGVASTNGAFAQIAQSRDGVIRMSGAASGHLIFANKSNSKGFKWTMGTTSWDVQQMELNYQGQLIIGHNVPVRSGYKLMVEDGILTEKVKVALMNSSEWADYVFHPNYELPSLSYVDSFIQSNGHLPNMKSAEQLYEEGGVELKELTIKQQEKIEELTLYIIELDKKISSLEKIVNHED